MSRPAAPWLSRSDLSDAVSRIFVDRELTWVECAAAYPIDAICETITIQATELVDVISDLPDEAFEAQPDDAVGNDVWSAGQVVSHLAETQVTALPFWEAVIGTRLEEPDDRILRAIDARYLARREAVATAEALQEAAHDLVEAVRGAPDLDRRATHFVLGTVDGPGALLATCAHGLDHLEQLEALRFAGANDDEQQI